jgi:hypothetical protein
MDAPGQITVYVFVEIHQPLFGVHLNKFKTTYFDVNVLRLHIFNGEDLGSQSGFQI